MKISMIGPVYPYRGGISHFTTILAKRLIAAGHEIQVISFKKQYPNWLYPGESDKDFSPFREKVEADYLLKPLNPISWIKTAKAISDYTPQQVIIPWWVTFWGPAFHHIISRLKMRCIPITILIHNTLPHETRLWDRFLARRTLQDGDRFIVMTGKEKERLQTLIPEVDQIEIVPHPIYQMFKPSSLSEGEIKSRLGLPFGKPIILFFGFVRPYKGLSDLIKALKIIINMKFEIHLVIAGEFWHPRESYDVQISDLELNDYVHIFEKYISDDEAAQFFQAADLFVAPYTEGTQSGSLKSALGFGLPAVVTNTIADKLVRNLPELCEIIPPGKPRVLADAILKKLGSPIMAKDQVTTIFERSWKTLLNSLIDQTEEISH